MTMNNNLPAEDGGGFDAEDWTRLTPFVGAVATLDDVQARRAVFALGDTDDPAAPRHGSAAARDLVGRGR